jgi:hypothetical protein
LVSHNVIQGKHCIWIYGAIWQGNKVQTDEVGLPKKIPNHPLFKDKSYWSTMKTQFNKKCKNTRITDTDTDLIEEQISIPLYRTIDDTLIRQKYRGDPTSLVDALAVSFSFIVNGSATSCHKLAEQNLSRHAIGRGGEHLFLQISQTHWDWKFGGADFDWTIIKQNDKKCSLHFCNYNQPYLCSYLGIAVFSLTGGLQHKGVRDGIRDFLFHDLHKIKPNSVADNLTASISRHLKVKYGEEKAKQILTCSSCKGGMTEGRANCELDKEHEYARSGHSGPEYNPVSVCSYLYDLLFMYVISHPTNSHTIVVHTERRGLHSKYACDECTWRDGTSWLS